MKHAFACGLAAVLLASPAVAQSPRGGATAKQQAVLSCIEGVGVSTEWGQCLGLMFGACEGKEVGGAAHLGCLTEEYQGWQIAMAGEREALVEVLTATGASELTVLMGQWFGYVAQKCSAVAAQKDASVAQVAQLGCEISEIAGVTAEFVACRQRRSTAPYCVIQE